MQVGRGVRLRRRARCLFSVHWHYLPCSTRRNTCPLGASPKVLPSITNMHPTATPDMYDLCLTRGVLLSGSFRLPEFTLEAGLAVAGYRKPGSRERTQLQPSIGCKGQRLRGQSLVPDKTMAGCAGKATGGATEWQSRRPKARAARGKVCGLL